MQNRFRARLRSDFPDDRTSTLPIRTSEKRQHRSTHQLHDADSVLVGSEDEIFYADRFAPLIHRQRPNAPVILGPGVDHVGMVTEPRALAAVATAIR